MPEEYPTPYPRSYWVISGRLLAGAFPGARDNNEAADKLQSLFDAGIRCIVNLMEPDERDHSGALFVDYAPIFERIHDLRYTDAERHRRSPETRAQVAFVKAWNRSESGSFAEG